MYKSPLEIFLHFTHTFLNFQKVFQIQLSRQKITSFFSQNFFHHAASQFNLHPDLYPPPPPTRRPQSKQTFYPSRNERCSPRSAQMEQYFPKMAQWDPNNDAE